jgi:hypothetical protein
MRLALSESRVGLRARASWISRRDPIAVGRKERKGAKAQRRKGIGCDSPGLPDIGGEFKLSFLQTSVA